MERSEGPDRPRVGIACSGGGIRAASYALGCLQALDEHGMLSGPHRADHLSAVSGGSYMVGGLMAARRSVDGSTPPEVAEPAPFAPGSPEVRRLRNRLGYLTHGPGGLGPEVWRVVLGIAINLTALVTAVATVARPAGWLYGWLVPQLRWGCGRPVPTGASTVCSSTQVAVPGWGWVGLAVIGVVASALAVRAALSRGGGSATAWRLSFGVLLGAAAWAAAVLALPQILAWLHRAGLPAAATTAEGVGDNFGWVPLGALSTLLASVAAAAAPVWRWLAPRRPSRPSVDGTTSPRPGPSVVSRLAGTAWARHRVAILNLVALVAGPVLMAALFLLFAHRGAARVPGADGGGDAFEVVRWLWPAAILALLAAVADVNSWSLHSLYRQRLADAFDVERVTSTPPVTPGSVPFAPPAYPQPSSATSVGGADARARVRPLPLTDAQPDDFPEVVVCATANLSDYGVTPTDQKAASFVWSATTVGGPATGAMPTGDYAEHAFGDRHALALFDAVAISGAAVAPSMGKMTRAPLRFLLALANVRLGVWVPNPTRVQACARYTGVFRRPGLVHLFREMFGANPRHGRFVYVSDGGHYDNLGLVELLARRCDWIWAVDASGDSIDTFSTLGQALSIARAELGVSVDIDPLSMAPAPDAAGLVKATSCRGTVHYPARPADPSDPGSHEVPAKEATLVVVKAGVPADAPWDVGAYHRSSPRFPCDPTSDQLYNAPRFDAYVSLGRFSMRQAWDAYGADLEILQGRAAGPATPMAPPSPLQALDCFPATPPA